MNFKFTCAVLFFCLAPLWAEEEVLTLKNALERAILENTDLAKSALDVETAAFADKHNWAQFLPGLSASGSASYGTSFTNPPKEENIGFSVRTGISLSLNPSLKASINSIRLAYKNKLLNYENAKKQILLVTEKNYYNILVENKNILVLEERLFQSEKQLEKDIISFKNGLLSALNMERSRLSVETARFDLSRSKLGAEAGAESFFSDLGFPLGVRFALEDNFEIKKIDVDADALVLSFLQKRTDIINAMQNVENLELEKSRRILQARSPSLSLSSSWGGNLDKPFSDSFSVSAGVSIPIDAWITGSSASQTIDAAKTNVKKGLLDLKETEKAAKNNIRTLVNSLSNYWRSIEIGRLRVEIASNAYEMTRIGFDNGREEFLALENSRNELASARQALLNEELMYKNTILDLAFAINVDVSDLEKLNLTNP